jgi:cytochrome c biogenesis protein
VLSIGSLTRGSADTGPRFTALTDDVGAALAARAPASPPPDEEKPPS